MKYMIKLIILALVAINLQASQLPHESSLVKGKLENGFEYTIKKNTKPSNKAEIRLIVKAGSLDEDDDQKGIAHLVEHMAFNGSKNFPGNSLITYLESIGVGFGSHLNASTGTTRTLYKLSVALEKDNLQKSFLVFKDWAGGLSFDPKELEKERGVVLEEARSRDNLNFRLYMKSKDTIYAGSKYKDRTPIGDLDIVKNIKVQRVKDFYTRWYRPNLMHLVVVGDIDVKEIENLINKYFSKLKNSSNEKTISRSVPKVNKQRVLFLEDEEITQNSLSVYFFKDYNNIATKEDYKQALLSTFAIKMFNLENASQLTKEDPVLNQLAASKSKLGDNLSMMTFSSSYDTQNKKSVINELVSTIYFHSKYGFKNESFEAVKKSLININELSYKKLKDKDSSTYAKSIVSSVLNNKIFIDEEYKYNLTKELLEKVSIKEVNDRYKDLISTEAQLFLFSSNKETKLTKDEVLKSVKYAKTNLKEPKIAKNLPKKLLEKKLPAKKIVSQKYNKDFDFWEFELQNGVKVLYKFNDYKKESVSLYGYSEGGFSLVSDELLSNAKYATSIVSQSGTIGFSNEDIKKIYADKSISLHPYISRYSEGFKGNSSAKDFKELLELLYLKSTDYKVNKNILNNTKRLLSKRIKKQNDLPKFRFSKEFTEFYTNNNQRFTSDDAKDIKKINIKDILDIYSDRFADSNNFTYVIVGDIDYEKVKDLTSVYLGNLPVLNKTETYKYEDVEYVSKPNKFIKNYEKQNISTLTLLYEQEQMYTLEKSIRINALKELLSVKLREYIREEKSGVYGIRVSSSISRIPTNKAKIKISFTCDPKRRTELLLSVKKTIDSLKKQVVDQKYVSAIKKKKLLAFEQSIKTPAFWKDRLIRYVKFGDKMDEINKYKKLYKSITPEIIKNEAQKYLLDENLIYSELSPVIVSVK